MRGCIEPEQTDLPQRAIGEVKAIVRRQARAAGNLSRLLRRRQIREVNQLRGEARRMNLLVGLPSNFREGGTQHLVAHFEEPKALGERLEIQRPVQVQFRGNIVEAAVVFELRQKPEPLLGERERDARADSAYHRLNRWYDRLVRLRQKGNNRWLLGDKLIP